MGIDDKSPKSLGSELLGVRVAFSALSAVFVVAFIFSKSCALLER